MNRNTSFEMESLDNISDSMFESIIDSIQKRDSEAIKQLFSKEALAEANEIDAAIEYLFCLFNGEVLTWERTNLTAGESTENGKYSRLIRSWYTVRTKNGKYLFLLLNYDRNDINSDLEGLYTLHGIDDANEDALWSDWVEMRVPGVYMPEN